MCHSSVDGKDHVQHTLKEVVKSVEDSEQLGAQLANILIETEARKILDDVNVDRDRRVYEAKTAEGEQW